MNPSIWEIEKKYKGPGKEEIPVARDYRSRKGT